MSHKMQPTLSLGMLRWGMVVENLVGITLETYVVHDHHDYHTLKGLWQHLKLRGRQPLIVISNFDVPLHTIPARMRVPPGVPCLLDVLGCTDSSLAHVVMNQVIDRVGCLTPHVLRHTQLVLYYCLLASLNCALSVHPCLCCVRFAAGAQQ